MGEVFLAERATGDVEQRAAIKLIRENHPASSSRFRRERQILARLTHPNIARFLDAGVTEGGRLYVVLEYVDGIPFTDYCDQRRLGIDQRLAMFVKICGAVQHAHQNLIVHCDLKPGNVLVGNDGEPKLLDFGISKLLDLRHASQSAATDRPFRPNTNTRYLTPVYASPEQRQGRQLTMATDTYSLGVLLHELLTGRLPVTDRSTRGGHGSTRAVDQPSTSRGPSSDVLDRRHGEATADELARASARSTSPRSLRRRLLGDLDAIVLRCLRDEPSDRYNSVDRLVEDVRRHLNALPIRARPAQLDYRIGKFVNRHGLAVGASLAAVLALSALGVSMIERSVEVARERDRAIEAQRESEQVTRFLTDTFRLASAYNQQDPGPAPTHSVTVREALEYSSDRVQRELVDQPALRARLLSTIGRAYVDLGEIDRAVGLLREAKSIRRKSLPIDHPDHADSLNGLGWALLQQGRAGRAEPMLRAALVASRALDRPSRHLLDSLLYLGDLVNRRGDSAAAIKLFEEALIVARELEHPPSQGVAEALTSLGVALRSQGQLDQAELRLRESLMILQRVRGEQHPEVASAMHALGWVIARKGDSDQASQLLRQALSITENVLGSDHPETLAHLASWGDYLTFRGDYEAAEPILRQTLHEDRKRKGHHHPDVAQSLNALALAIWQQGKLEAAEPHLREALAIAHRHWGRENKRTAVFTHNLGALLHELERSEEAASTLEDALEIRIRLLGDTHTEVAITLTVLADLRVGFDDYERALELATKAETILAATLSAQHWRTAIAQSVRAECLIGLGYYEEAERLLMNAVPRIEAARGTDSRPARAAQRRVERLVEARAASGAPSLS